MSEESRVQQQSPKRARLEEPQDVAETNPFLHCANLILPLLTPQELAAVSLTCKTLALICKFVTFRRSSDAARSLESLPVPFCNAVDGHRYAYFVYTPRQILDSSTAFPSLRQRWGTAPDGGERVRTAGKAVSRASPDEVNGTADLPDSGSSPDSDDRLRRLEDSDPISESASENGSKRRLDSADEPGDFGVSLVDESGERVSGCGCLRCDEAYCPCMALAGVEIAKECGSACGCGSDCSNRITQKGVSVRLKIVKDEKKGWCLYSDQFIKQGQFICEYAGELLTTAEAQRRQKIYDKLRQTGFSSALLVVREHLPSGQACLRINIDATRIGNIARFINHSCDGGNLSTVLLRSLGELLPRLCFFASKDINPDKELAFSYGDVRVRSNGMKCFCGSSCCAGTLPCENT